MTKLASALKTLAAVASMILFVFSSRRMLLSQTIDENSYLLEIESKLAPRKLSTSQNPLLSILEDVAFPIQSKTQKDNTQFFWSMPPNAAGGSIVKDIMEQCFDLNRHEMLTNDIDKLKVAESQKDILILSNLNILPIIFDPILNSPIPGPQMFSFFMHPNLRAAFLFQFLQLESRDPHYDKRISTMDLRSYLNFLNANGNENHFHRYRMSNWVTRSLVQKPRNLPITETDVMIATDIVRKKCLVGLFDEFEESLQRFSTYFNWKKINIPACLKEWAPGGAPSTLIGPVEWDMLSVMNQADIALFVNIKSIFDDQRKQLVRPMKVHYHGNKELSFMTKNFIKVSEMKLGDTTSQAGHPVFWVPPPSSAGGYVLFNIIDTCFDLTRGEIVENDVIPAIKYMSIKKRIEVMNGQSQQEIYEDVLVVSNLKALPFRLKHLPDHISKAKMFTFLAHPVRRAAHMIQYLQKNKNDPHYDPRVKDMDLSAYLKFMSQDGNQNHYHKFRFSNWLTRSITLSSRDKVLRESDLDLASHILGEYFYVGFYEDNFKESLERLKMAYSWKGGIEACFNIGQVPVSAVDGSFINVQDWKQLAEYNRLDIQLYENAKGIFYDQAELFL